jgi:hypothetical protein
MRTGLGFTLQKMKSATLARSDGSVPAFLNKWRLTPKGVRAARNFYDPVC